MTTTEDGMLAQSGLTLRGPTAVAIGGRVVALGRVGVLLLVALDRGPISVRSAKVKLWDDADAPDGRLRQAAVRVNRKLAADGWQWRVRLDAGDILLMSEPGAGAHEGTERTGAESSAPGSA